MSLKKNILEKLLVVLLANTLLCSVLQACSDEQAAFDTARREENKRRSNIYNGVGDEERRVPRTKCYTQVYDWLACGVLENDLGRVIIILSLYSDKRRSPYFNIRLKKSIKDIA